MTLTSKRAQLTHLAQYKLDRKSSRLNCESLFSDEGEFIKESYNKFLKSLWLKNCAVNILVSKEIFYKVKDVTNLDDLFYISEELYRAVVLARTEHEAQRRVSGYAFSAVKIMYWDFDDKNAVHLKAADSFETNGQTLLFKAG